MLKKHKTDFGALFKEAKWDDFFDFGWGEVYYLIKKIPVTDNYEIKWHTIDGGGGTSAGGSYIVRGTIGQHDTGCCQMADAGSSFSI